MIDSKTPQFDAALSDYFSKLELDEKGGQERICRFSGEKFYVRPEDVEFYKKIKVPLPTLSPAERLRRRDAYMDTENLYKVKSSHSGEEVIAAYSPDTKLNIYEHQIWFSDKWNPLSFGKDWSNERSFFEQLRELQQEVPRPNLITNSTNINSDYTNTSTNLKNCYLAFDTLGGEDLYYFSCCDGCKNCIDCGSLWSCDTCYGCFDLHDSYKCFFCYQSRNCTESCFLFDCRSCDNCFMSANLRNKKYVFMNEQLSKEEYEERMKEVDLGNYDELQKYSTQFAKLVKNAKRKPDHNFKSVNSVGEYIETSKNCYMCFYSYDSENVAYSMGFAEYKDSYDIIGGGGGELCYELATISTSGNYNVHFSSQIDNSRNLEYCDLSRNCNDCFGSIGLANKSFCIFNKQYIEEEYWEKLDEIKTDMLKRGEYGEFFPPENMPVPYKISLNAAYPGFRDYENAKQYGYNTENVPPPKNEAQGDVVEASQLPASIKDTGDDILNKVIADRKNDRYFKLTKFELDFYRKHNIAIPREHPLIRLSHFREMLNLRLTFYDAICKKCDKDIQSTLNPEEYENIYCEACYNTEIA